MADNSKIVNNSLLKSSISIKSIQNSVSNFAEGIVNAKQTASKIVEQTNERIKFKQTLIGRDNEFFRRRRQAVLRRQREDELEASGISGAIKRQGTLIQKSTKGFLGRILDFIGILLIGWLVTTLPTIIKGVQEILKRMRTLVNILTGFVDGIRDIFTGIGTALDNFMDRFKREDYETPEKELRENLTRAEGGFLSLNNNLINAVNPFTDPKNFDLDTFDVPLEQEETEKTKTEQQETPDTPPTKEETQAEEKQEKTGENISLFVDDDQDVEIADASNVQGITSASAEEISGEPIINDIDTAAKKDDVRPSFTADVRGLDGTELTTNEEAQQEQALEDTGFSMFNKGGKVEGKPGIDNVLAKLTSGEFIMTKETTERIGANFFEALNKGGKIDQMISSMPNQEMMEQIQAKMIDKTQAISQLAKKRKGTTIMMVNNGGRSSASLSMPSRGKSISFPPATKNALSEIHHILHRYT